MTENSYKFIEQCVDCFGSAAHADIMWETLPVPWFGDVLSKRIDVATVALNPSWREFETEEGIERKLKESKERLPVVMDFGAQGRYCEVPCVRVQQGAAARTEYFDFAKSGRKPNGWFDALQDVMTATGRNWSYAGGTAVHLDLVACATRRVWRYLSGKAQKDLVSKCSPNFIDTLLKLRSEARLMLDGKRVFESMESQCGAVARLKEPIWDNITVWRGHLSSDFGQREFLGWNQPVNQQKKLFSPFAWKHGQHPLADWLRQQVR
jgi:hypothetical protein